MSDYLIDLQTAIEAMSRISDSICEAEAVDALCEVPTIELIRCKECKYRDKETANCTRFRKDWYVQSNSFCSWAEPKDTTEEVRKQLKDMEQRREMDRKK